MDFPRFKGYIQRGPNPGRGQRRRKAWDKLKEDVRSAFTKKPKEPKSGKIPKGKLTYLRSNDEPICTECAIFKKGGNTKRVKGIGRWKGKNVPGMYKN